MALPHIRRSLRLQLVAILAIALTPLLTLSIIQGAVEFEDERREHLQTLDAASAIAAEELDSALQRALGISSAIEEGGYGISRPRAECDEALARIADNDPAISNITLINAYGQIECSVLPPPDEGEVPADRALFERLRNGDETGVSRVVFGPMSKRPILIAARRRGTPENFAGYIGIAIDIDAATTRLQEDLLPEGATLALWDPEGIFTITQDAEPLPFDRIPEPYLNELVTADETQLVNDAQFADGALLLLSPLINGHVGTLVVSPRGPAYSVWAGFDLVGTILIPTLMWALAIVCVWIAIDRFVLRWLTYLRRIARLYGDGRLDIDPSRAKRAPLEVEELADTLANMAASLRQQHQELESALEQRGALLREIHHRVKNNLQVIVSLLNLQAGRLPEGPGRAALYEARRRINALALVHRSLYEAEDLRRVEMRPFLKELLNYVSDASQASEQAVIVNVESTEIEMEPDYAVPLALFVTEAANNAFKHAFEDRKSGTILVSLIAQDEATFEIAVEDDGSGLADDASEGTGSTLMQAFAQQLSGKIVRSRTDAGGTRVAIRFDYKELVLEGHPADFH